MRVHQRKFKRSIPRARYAVVLHEVRSKPHLSLSTYAVIDSVHKLSRTNPEHPYCTMTKEQLASFLKLGRATVFRAIQEGITKRLFERNKEGHLHFTTKIGRDGRNTLNIIAVIFDQFDGFCTPHQIKTVEHNSIIDFSVVFLLFIGASL